MFAYCSTKDQPEERQFIWLQYMLPETENNKNNLRCAFQQLGLGMFWVHPDVYRYIQPLLRFAMQWSHALSRLLMIQCVETYYWYCWYNRALDSVTSIQVTQWCLPVCAGGGRLFWELGYKRGSNQVSFYGNSDIFVSNCFWLSVTSLYEEVSYADHDIFFCISCAQNKLELVGVGYPNAV